MQARLCFQSFCFGKILSHAGLFSAAFKSEGGKVDLSCFTAAIAYSLAKLPFGFARNRVLFNFRNFSGSSHSMKA